MRVANEQRRKTEKTAVTEILKVATSKMVDVWVVA
jgi:hypothetical protein